MGKQTAYTNTHAHTHTATWALPFKVACRGKITLKNQNYASIYAHKHTQEKQVFDVLRVFIKFY